MSRRMKKTTLALAAATTLGCTPHVSLPSPSADAAAPVIAEADGGTALAASADAFAPPPVAPPSAGSPFAVVAVGRLSAGLHQLASGELLVDHGRHLRTLAADGRLEPFLTADAGGLNAESNFIGAVVGASLDEVWFSINDGNHRAGYSSHMFHARAGQTPRIATLPDARSWFYLDARNGPGGRLLGLRAIGAVEFDQAEEPWRIDRIEVLRGAPMKLPRWAASDFRPAGWAVLASGDILVAGDRGALDSDRLPAVLRSTPDSPAGAWSTLPDGGQPDEVTAVVSGHGDDVYIGGVRTGDTRHARLWRLRGETWTNEETPSAMRGIGSLALEPDGTLWAVETMTDGGGVWRRHPGGTFVEVPLPALRSARFAVPPPRLSYDVEEGVVVDRRAAPLDDASDTTPDHSHDATPLRARALVTRGDDDTWIVATHDADFGHAYLLHTTAGPAAGVVDLDQIDQQEIVAAENETRAPAAGTKCETIFVSLGEPTTEAIARYRAQQPTDAGAGEPPELVVRGTIHGAPVFGRSFGKLSRPLAAPFAQRWRGLGWTVTAYCRRPVLEGLIE